MDRLERQEAPRPRQVDHSNAEARRAVADIASRLEPLRTKVALISARADRPHSADARQQMLAQCSEIDAAFQQARIDLLERLIEAPRKVAGHTRVIDLERAIDNLEAAARAAERRLQTPH